MLEDAFIEGLFHDPDWAIVWFRGRKMRANGKHSSLFLAGLNGDFPKGLSVRIQQFECDTEIDLATLFAQFDPSRSVRTRGDNINVHRAIEPTLREVSQTSTACAVAGLTWLLRQDAGVTFKESDQLQLVHSHAEFIAWVDQYVGMRRLKRTGVVAAMFATWSKDATAAKAFWDHTREQDHEDPKHPTRKLGRFLELSILDPTDPQTKQKWDTRAFYVKCIHAWNAFRAGEGTDLKYHPTAPLPKVR